LRKGRDLVAGLNLTAHNRPGRSTISVVFNDRHDRGHRGAAPRSIDDI